jgi:glutamate/aspartate transport system permease protein
MDFDVIVRNAGYMLGGLGLSAALAVMTLAGGLSLGLLLALARLSSRAFVYYPATIYIYFFRGIPLILVIFWIYFLVPVIIQRPVEEFRSAVIAFVVFEAAYFAEILRAGIQSVPAGQAMAARASGLNSYQAARYVVLPQALRNMAPALMTQTVIIFQDTSLAYVIGLREFLRRVNLTDAREMRSVELYLFAGLVYLVICSAGALASQRLEKKSALAL